jgi:stage II sporulation protein M
MSYKWWVLIAIILFAGGLLLGLATPSSLSGLPSQDLAQLKELAGFLVSLPPWAAFIFIFLKNVSALLVSLILSPILCLIPAFAVVVNAWLLGFVSAAVVQEKSVGYLLAGVLPHGIFEIPAFIMGEAVAFSLGAAVLVALFRKDKRAMVGSTFKSNAKYLVIALALFLLAAIIEAYVTPLFLR